TAALRAGLTPVFCETDARDYCLDVEDAISRLSDRTVAVVVVHLAGFIPHGIALLHGECERRGIPIIEDCAHAAGASLDDRMAGAIGAAGCFSFYPTKVLTCGVGGMITTDHDDLATMARTLRHHGVGSSMEEIVELGSDWLMDEVRAVIARAQLRRLDEILVHRRAVALSYKQELSGSGLIRLPVAAPGCEPAFYKFPVALPDGVDRDRVRTLLRERHGIETGTLYDPPAHQMPAFQSVARGVSLPWTDALLARQLCLPMHLGVDPADCGEIVATLEAMVVEEARAC
ncbi:MAG: DegT/DnrJ/EryC1/StrS family aminotransferase, partial [Myxococcota bacterium]